MERRKGKYMRLHFLVLIIQIFDNVLSCPASIPTISYVSYCPRSQIEWEKAAQRKNCESVAVIQNCTSPNDFKYHCLMNHWKNATLEVCAPIFYLQGYCAEYNIQIKQVAEIYDEGFECLKFPDTHKCPRRYPSIDAYKYQRCYRNKIKNLSTKKFTNSSKDNSVIPLVFILIVLLLFGIVASVVMMLNKGICDKLTKVCQQTNKKTEQNKKDETGEETGLLTVDRNVKDNSDVQAEEITITKKETEKQATDLKEEVKIAVEKQEDSTTDNKIEEKKGMVKADEERKGNLTTEKKKLADANQKVDDLKKQMEKQCDSEQSLLNDISQSSTQGEKQGLKTKKAPPRRPTEPPKKDSSEREDRSVEETVKKKKPAPPPPSSSNQTNGT